MPQEPTSADWRNLAHSIEVLAAASNARDEIDGSAIDSDRLEDSGGEGSDASGAAAGLDPDEDSGGPVLTARSTAPQDWLNFAHSIDVLTASASATEEVAALRMAAPTTSLFTVSSARTTSRQIAFGRWRMNERSALAALSAVAAVLVIAAVSTAHLRTPLRSGPDQVARGSRPDAVGERTEVASADIAANGQALVQALRCRSGQDCWSDQQGPTTVRSVAPEAGRARPVVTGTEQGRTDIEARLKSGALPGANMTIAFDFNSAAILETAKPVLNALGQAMAGPSGVLGQGSFSLIGNAEVSETDSLALSERRARAVAGYLIETFSIDSSRFDAYGRGASPPGSSAELSSRSKRGVQIVNLGRLTSNPSGDTKRGADCKRFLPLENVTVTVPCN